MTCLIMYPGLDTVIQINPGVIIQHLPLKFREQTVSEPCHFMRRMTLTSISGTYTKYAECHQGIGKTSGWRVSIQRDTYLSPN